MSKIYLAGGMKDGWQDEVMAAMGGHEFLDPRSWQTPNPAEYTARDIAAIRDCDYVVAYMASNNPSGFGLSVEIGYAYGIGKPIVFIDAIKSDWRSRYFDMHRTMATALVNEIGLCASAIEAMKRGNYP